MSVIGRPWRDLLPVLVVGALAGASLAAGCGGGGRRYSRDEVQKYLKQLEQPGLVIGEFPLADDAILDGDTIRVGGLRTTLRLLAIDTEETFKKEHERRLFEEGWDGYLRKVKGDSARPVKAPTPLGEEAKKFAKDFFAGVSTVRLERDHPKEIRGRFNRYLAYVLVWKGDRWVNYNLECVRAGMSPYFTKYSYSRRFHNEFVAAEREARAAKRGIWSADGMHYDDYPVRLKWWNARADFIKAFEDDAEGQEDHIVLTHWDALKRLEEHLDQEVVLLGSVVSIKLGDRGPTRVMLGRRQRQDFPLIFFDKDVFLGSNIDRYKGEFVRVKGKVQKYRNTYRDRDELQIVVNLPGQIEGPKELPDFMQRPVCPPGTTEEPAKEAPRDDPR